MPATGMWAGLAAPGGRGVAASCFESTTDRRFDLGPVQPGRYQLLVLVHVRRTASVVAIRRSVSLAPGANRVSEELPPFHSLEITGLEAGEALVLDPEPDRRWTRFVLANADASGRASFASLPARRYRLRRQDGRTMAVDLARSLVVPFEGDR